MRKVKQIVSLILGIVFLASIFVITSLFTGCSEQLKDLTFAGSILPEGTFGAQYSATIDSAEGEGNPVITYKLKQSGSLPAGLVFNNGVISGTPTAITNGSVSFKVIAKAEGFNDAEAEFSINIKKADIIYSSSNLSDAFVGVPYSGSVATATTVGGAAIKYELKQGSSLPEGLSFNNGEITGTPTQPTSGPVYFTVVAKVNNNYNEAEAQFAITVRKGSLNYTVKDLAKGTVGIGYNENVATATGAAQVSYSLKDEGSLPAGLSFNDGIISGTPTEAVVAKTFIVVACADGYDEIEVTFSITIDPGTINYESQGLSGTVGEAFYKDIRTAVAVGTLNPAIDYTLKSGTLPAGLSFNNGVISGTPAQKTEQPVVIVITASASGYISKDVEFNIVISNQGEIAYSGFALSAKVGIEYSCSIATATAGGGNPTITYTIVSGTLPEGLNFNNGQINGVPTTVTNSATFVVLASAENFDSKEATFVITVEAGSITYKGSVLPQGTTEVAYNASIATATADGTITPVFTYTLKAGSLLPAGLELSISGEVTGIPSAAVSNHSFTVIVTAANFTSKEATFMITIIENKKNSFIFEAAVADLSRFKGGSMYYGGEHTGPSVIERTGIGNNSWDTVGHLTPYFLQGTHNSPGQTITWMINSSVATTATLKMSLAIEIPGTFYMNSESSGGGHVIKVNDDVITYGDIVLSRQSLDSPMQFNLWTIATINLKEGINVITFTTGMNDWLRDFPDAYTEVGGPAIECIVLETTADLTWATGYPKTDNLLTNFPFDEWKDPNNK